jgi:hypothetical protein
MDDRKTFLLEMYRQMFSDINRHMTVVWQSVSVVVGAFAIFALVEKQILPIDVAVSLMVMLCAWLYAHMLDAAYWYNRNLVIIANIERIFLLASDARDVQYYFTAHRSSKNRMIMQLRIQSFLGLGIGIIVLMFHISERVWPGVSSSLQNFELSRALPYLTAVCAIGYCRWLTGDRRAAYQTFLQNSPGIPACTDGIAFGPGHTIDP